MISSPGRVQSIGRHLDSMQVADANRYGTPPASSTVIANTRANAVDRFGPRGVQTDLMPSSVSSAFT